MSDESDTNIDRRSVLKKSAVGAFGFGGLLGRARSSRGVGPGEERLPETLDERASQDEPERARFSRRIALDYPERLDGGPRKKIILMTDRTNDDPDVSEVDGCNFSNWPPDRLTLWEGIVVDWQNAARDFGFGLGGGVPTVRANRLVEIERIFVDEQDTPVPLGTPYIVSGVESCPGKYRGLTATKLPGVNIKTGEDVSTSG